MVKPVKFFLCTFLILLVSCNQNKTVNTDPNNDSIKKYLDLASNESLTSDLRNQYNKKAFSLIDLSKNDTVTRFYLSENSRNNLRLNNWNEFKRVSKIHFQKSIQKKDTLNLARCYRYKGWYYKDTEVNDSAFMYYLKSEKLFRELKDNLNLASVLSYKSMIQYNIGDLVGADRSLTQAYKLLKNINEPQKLYIVYTMMGIVANETKEYKKAINYYTKALGIIRKNNLNDTFQEVTCLNNMGFNYQNLGNNEKAIFYFKKALNNNKLVRENPGLYATLIDNLAYSNFKLNNFKQLPSMFYKSLKIRDSLKLVPKVVFSKIHLSEYYFKTNNKKFSKEIASDALNDARTIGYSAEILLPLIQLSKVDSINSGKYSGEYIKINDSLQAVERYSRDKFERIAYETDEIQQEKEAAIKQKWIIGGIALVIILIIVLLLIISRQRSKQKELLLLQSQQKANEEIYQLMLAKKTIEEKARQKEKKRIALELHDGIMNKLASTRLNLFVLSKKTDTATIEKCLTYISGIHTIEQEIRSIAHDLNRDVFKESNSFSSIIKDFINEQNNISKAKYVLELQQDINWITISSEIKMNLYRILQEASHNINKYSKAKNVIISIILDANNICMAITDDGIGFDAKTVSGGIGIQNMQQRIQSLNGKININSVEKNSTCINISIPV